jgi:hypothetical protein
MGTTASFIVSGLWMLLAVFVVFTIVCCLFGDEIAKALEGPDAPLGAKPELEPEGIVSCRGCGRDYHNSWGRFCPDCTGAD